MDLVAFEDFDGTTLNPARWRVLGEPGMTQTSPLAPVLQWGDHWGATDSTWRTPSYIHDPAAVNLQNSVLSLGWRYINSIWRAGAITSATAYSPPRGNSFSPPAHGLCEVKFRVPVLPAGFGAFYGAFLMPSVDSFGGWPSSGEKTTVEMTQHPDGVAVNPSGHIAFSDLPNNWGPGGAAIDFRGNSSALTNPSVSVLDGQWHTVSQHQYASGVEEILDFYFDGRRYHRMTIPASHAERVRGDWYWLLVAQGMGFWGVGFPPNATLTNYYFEIDSIKHYAPAAPPTTWAITPYAATRAEGNSGATAFTFRVGRAGASLPAATVNYAVSGMATGADFVGGSLPMGQLIFAAAEDDKELTINVAGDATYEPDETFTVTISAPSHGVVATATATGTIQNDDAAPPSGSKPNTSARATAMGLTRLWQDRLGDPNEPPDPWDFYMPNLGVRHNNDSFNHNDAYDRRISYATLNHAPPGITPPIRVLRIRRDNGKVGSLNYLSSWYPGNYNKFFISWWVYYDANFADIINTQDGFTYMGGKSPFLIVSGGPTTWQPGTNWHYTSVCANEHAKGNEFGLNWVVRTSNKTRIEYTIYGHIPGFGTSWRADSYSNWGNLVGGLPSNANALHPAYLSLGAWHLVEMYVEIGDTRTSGKMYTWIDGTLGLRLEGMDLGGWVGNRGWYHGMTKANYQNFGGASITSSYDTDPLGTLAGPPYGGWRNKGGNIREMNGGWGENPQFICRANSSLYLWNCMHWAA